MKFLVVSLLRLGDILMAASVVRSLKKKHPGAEVHILINGQFRSVARLIPYVDKVYTFDRDGIQQIIGTENRSLLEAYFRIEDLTEQLRSEKYEQVFNLTHNRLSGWMTALIGCPKTHGVMFGPNGKFYVGSRWFQYLNDFAETTRQNNFHFIDVFHYGAGLDTEDRRIELRETPEGASFAEKLTSSHKRNRRIVFQLGSSEAKKTFSPSKWKEIAAMVSASEPDAEIFVLGSPAERDLVAGVVEDTRCVPVVCDLEGAFSLLQRSHLLITSDTSIKHLAAATKVKIVEISIGSSDFRKTGAYCHGAVIVQGVTACSPCPHREPCSKASHECADRISAELVTVTAAAVLRGDESALRIIAHEFKDEAVLLKTKISATGDWSACPLAHAFSREEIARWIDRASFKLYLQKAHERPVAEFGSEGLELKRLLQSIFPDQSWREWVSELKQMETNMMWFETHIGGYLSKLKEVLGNFQQSRALEKYLKDLEIFSAEMGKTPVLSSYAHQIALSLKDAAPQAMPFQAIKHLRENLSNAHQRTKIELKLIRGLQTGFMEIV